MASRSQRMQLIERLAQQRVDQAAQALAQTRQRIEQEERQLQELYSYQDEYRDYLQQQGGAGMSILQWRRTQGFIDQLGKVINQQMSVIQQWRSQEAQLLESWRSLHQRRQSVTQLVEKLTLEEFIEADRQEQKALDEMVNQMMQRSSSER